jgi:hypothetical protein
MINIKKILHFTQDRLVEKTLAAPNLRVLEGCKESTLVSYNAAIKKFATFKKSTTAEPYLLPVPPDNIYTFVVWAGQGVGDNGSEKINPTLLSKYLYAMKAWHTFHNTPYPYQTNTQVELMLKVLGQQEAVLPKQGGKLPVQIINLANLLQLLSDQGLEDKAIKDLAIVASWEMARLAELTYSASRGPARHMKEIVQYPNIMVLQLHKDKPAKPREVQPLKLQQMPSPLCQVKAIEKCRAATRKESDSLFGYRSTHGRVNLTKRQVNKVLAAAWRSLGKPHLTGHSFRVGGATLKNASSIPVAEIKSLGHWTTNCYQLCIKPLSQEEAVVSLDILELSEF